MSIDNELKSTWEEFAQNTKGKFQYDESVFPLGDKFKCQIVYEIDDYKIHFVSYRHRTATINVMGRKTFTKVFVPLSKEIEFRFSVYPESIAAKILKVVGLQDINIGIDELDKEFIFKGNDERIIKKIFSDRQVSKLMLANHDLNLRIKQGKKLLETELPENFKFLIFESDQLIRDNEFLDDLLAVFKAVMIELKKEIKTVYSTN